MSSQPIEPILHVPTRPLTVAEYIALGEIERGYSELVEGSLLMSPSPVPGHSLACSKAWLLVGRRLPPHLVVIQDVDVDLGLVPGDQPGYVRRPDLIVVTQDALLRVEREGGVIRAAEVVVAMEVVSRSSRRTDHVTKRGEYADAGIPYYWIVDLGKPVTLLACHLAGEFGYADSGVVTGTFRITDPFPCNLRLDDLL